MPGPPPSARPPRPAARRSPSSATAASSTDRPSWPALVRTVSRPSSSSSTTAGTGSCASTNATPSARPSRSISSQPDFAALAQSYGVAHREATVETLADDLRWALGTDGPAAVVLRTHLEMWTPTRLVPTRWSDFVKPTLGGLEPYRPGDSVAALRERHGLEEVVKLNWNEGLFGPLPGVLEAAAAELANAWMYPEQAYSDLRNAIAAWLDVPPDCVVPGHGIQSLVTTLAAAAILPGDRAVLPRPTYGLYAQVLAAAGAEVERVPVRGDLGLDLDAMAIAAHRTEAKLVVVCDPNNPTGLLMTRDEWEAFSGRAARGLRRRRRRGVRRVRRPGAPARPRAGRCGRTTGGALPDLLEDLRPRRAAARLRDRERGARALSGRRPGALQREPRRPGRRHGERRACGSARGTPPPGRGGARAPGRPARGARRQGGRITRELRAGRGPR